MLFWLAATTHVVFFFNDRPVNHEVYLLHAHKHASLLQVDTIILHDCNQACPNYPKYFCISLQYLHKSMGDEVNFLPADKHKSFFTG